MGEVDRALFALLNRGWTHPWLDDAMPLITNSNLWIPMLAAVALWLWFGADRRWRPLVLCLGVAVGLADLTSARLIKPWVGRPRPCCAEPEVRLLVGCSKSRSYPSSHAANAGAVAGVVLGEAGWVAGLPVLVMALAVCYSRVYVGVHYPLDVGGGFCLGLALARLVLLGRRRWWGPPPGALSGDSGLPPGVALGSPASTAAPASVAESPTGSRPDRDRTEAASTFTSAGGKEASPSPTAGHPTVAAPPAPLPPPPSAGG